MATASPGFKAQIYTTGGSIPFSGQSMSLVSGNTYQIINEAFNVWDWSQTITVYEDGVVSTNVENINFLSGKVTFSSAPTSPVTVDGAYLPKILFALGTSIDRTRSTEELDVTSFGDTDVQRIHGLQDIEVSIEGFQTLLDPVDTGEKSLSEVMGDRDFLVLVYKPNEDILYDERAVIMFTEQSLSQAVDDVMNSTVEAVGAAPRSSFGNQVIFERG